ncbi:MAG TPA: protein kinase [Vicinamibacterales bacterium]|nr:protein kinase [Vicinamibacterales bacterium]
MVSLHERAKDVFLAVLERPSAERRAFIAEACAADDALCREVESLLKFHEETGSTNVSGTTTGHPGASNELATDVFNPGDVFAGRYRMVTRLGRGGMGDVWRADDLVLETPVALKLIKSSGPAARSQVLNEVRLARQITHPAVCRVFDVGEDSGIVFFSMELVNGEDLATLLRRVGRLTTERVLEIARQLCSGLAAAHAQGVLHRDLKPANILIDNHGRVIITDFGIAILREDGLQRKLIGTPGYMAPEQLTPGATLTECTDIYALGLILYELLVGQHPFNNRLRGTAEPPTPSSRVTGVDPRLEHVILQALKIDPRQRPHTAAGMVESLADVPSTPALPAPAVRRRPWILGATAALVAVLAVAAALWFFAARPGTALTGQDTIVLADFSNTTGDPVFDGALKVALSVALEQSPFLKVYPDDRMHETLRLMGRPPDAAVTRSVAREVAQREQLKVLLAGSIAGLGRNFVLALEAVNADTGDVMAREQVEASSKEEVLGALGAAAARLRGKLGESLASIQKFDAPLARATTPSLDALHAYSLALDNGSVNPRLEAIPHLRRAIELDPNFALAMALLATVYSNTGQTSLAPEYAKKAYDLRDRVSERERFFIAYRYNRDATQNWGDALELSRSWTATYPREAFAFNSLGQSLLRFGQYEQSLVPLRESIRLDPRFEAPYSNLAGSLLALGRYDEVASVLQDAAAARLNSYPIRRMNYLLALIRGDNPTMARMLGGSVGVGQTNAAYGWEAHVLASRGRIAAAHEQFQLGMKMALQNGFQEVAGQLSIEDAEIHAMVDACDAAREQVAAGLKLTRDNYSLERASRTLILCSQFGEADQLLRELRERFPSATLTNRISIPIAEAAEALQRGNSKAALEILERVKPYDRASRSAFWSEYLRGQALLRQRQGAEAATEFTRILDHRGEDPTSSVYPLARLGLARAQAITGDVGNARQTYDAFLGSWADGDAGLKLVADARDERARLK